jgi:hypothetical protein
VFFSGVQFKFLRISQQINSQYCGELNFYNSARSLHVRDSFFFKPKRIEPWLETILNLFWPASTPSSTWLQFFSKPKRIEPCG